MVVNVILACAAVVTVYLSMRALHYARTSSQSSGDAAKSAADTTDAVSDMAREFGIARERDRIISEESRLHEIQALVENLQDISRRTGGDTPSDWIVSRNLLLGRLRGYEETFPKTMAAAEATSSRTSDLASARVEIFELLRAMAVKKNQLDFG